jgi:2,3-bisphosphoglycerate-dependent phosphoglycerate mutase
VFSGWRDSKLTPMGKTQAKALNAELKNKKIDVCITSDLSRSIDTGKLALKGMNVKFEEDTRIRERNYGDLNGYSKSKLLAEDPVKAVKYRRFFDFPPPGGESMKMVKNRVDDFCDELLKRIRKTGENVAISCHGNSMKMIRLYFEQMSITESLEQENPLGQDYAEYVVTPTGFKVNKTPTK